MKHSEEIPAKAKEGSPLPRFLRGLFGGRAADTAQEGGEAGVVVDAEPGAAPAKPSAPAIQPVDGHRPKILVVDDDAVVLKTLEMKLSKAGCEVVVGRDGSEAVTTARKEHPDVIILDVNFPADVGLAWDGIGVMKWLKRLESKDATPMIIITGVANDQIRVKALAAGANAFFQKPIDNDGLVVAINKVLDLRRKSAKPVKSAEFLI